MKIGLVGKPNVGKSTFFKASTLKDVAIADYPFTTIEPNHGVGYVRTPCPHVGLQVACDPQHGLCLDGTRFVPVELVDVAGLVPGAHEGHGLGNKFLDDLRQAHAFIHVVDATGSSNAEGQPVEAGTHDPMEDLVFLDRELSYWIRNILLDGWQRVAKKTEAESGKVDHLLAEKLAGLGLGEAVIHAALRETRLDAAKPSAWDPEALLGLAEALRRLGKPTMVALNKADKADPARVEALRARIGEDHAVATSADAEMALRNAAKANLVRYTPGAAQFELVAEDRLNPKQRQALDHIRHHVLEPYRSTGVLDALERTAYGLLKQIVVFPVEDDHKYTDKKGRVLPDAHLVAQGSTARDLAYRVHTDFGENFIRAVDARTKRVIGADHVLQNGDVVRIVAGA